MRRLLLALVLLTCGLLPARGSSQSLPSALRVNVLRALAFADVVPGAPSAARGVAPTDTGVFEVLGPAGQQVELWFVLPESFGGDRGGSLSVRFDGTSASYSLAQTQVDRRPLDPRLRSVLTIPASGRLLVFIGGRAYPHTRQPTGRYSAAVFLFAAPVP